MHDESKITSTKRCISKITFTFHFKRENTLERSQRKMCLSFYIFENVKNFEIGIIAFLFFNKKRKLLFICWLNKTLTFQIIKSFSKQFYLLINFDDLVVFFNITNFIYGENISFKERHDPHALRRSSATTRYTDCSL